MVAERPAICVLLRRLTEGRTWRRKASAAEHQGTNAAKSADRPAEALSIQARSWMLGVGSSGIEGGLVGSVTVAAAVVAATKVWGFV